MKELESVWPLMESWGVEWDVLMNRLKRPPLDAPSTKAFWDDPHISTQMMRFHLDPAVEAASKTHDTINAECAFLNQALDLQPGKTLVDLGCGPGLYLERWINTGAILIGVDLSPIAIATAQARLNAPIHWINADYRQLPDTLKADAMTLIYYDFTALPVKDQELLLSNIYEHLKPNGLLALDVMTPHNPMHESMKVRQHESGFWSPQPHVEIHQVFVHNDPLVLIDQYTLINEHGHLDTIRIQNRLLTKVELDGMLKHAGLTPVLWLSDLSGTPEDPNASTLAVIAQKSHSQQ